MNLFDALVDGAMAERPEFGTLRPAVEMEILHHDILREMARAGLLGGLTFIGGTCLRDCYGSIRLSEDLDFTGGPDFNRSTLSELGSILARGINEKYGLRVTVGDPVREEGNVDTWKLKIITRPERPDLPSQKINIDVCAVSSHDRIPAMIRNHYALDLGTSGLVLGAESREELMADKILALGQRPNRPKYRDIWDIAWLAKQGTKADPSLVALKLEDRRIDSTTFRAELSARMARLRTAFTEYRFELHRFLPLGNEREALDQPGYWDYILSVLADVAPAAIAFHPM
jgi:predicted nucleotidyltransferase component of viral defense system